VRYCARARARWKSSPSPSLSLSPYRRSCLSSLLFLPFLFALSLTMTAFPTRPTLMIALAGICISYSADALSLEGRKRRGGAAMDGLFHPAIKRDIYRRFAIRVGELLGTRCLAKRRHLARVLARDPQRRRQAIRLPTNGSLTRFT